MSNDREEDVANVEREGGAQQNPQSGAGLVTGTTTPHAAAKGLPDAGRAGRTIRARHDV